jgi:signal transduction histidine kinase/ligand-binding sensor domain-containing protein/CheY-like chemotaxis protein
MAGAASVMAMLCAHLAPAAPFYQPAYTTATFSLESGLPRDVVLTLLQDRKGYLWAGTESGLARFDGAKFDVFRASESGGTPDSLIRCLCEDGDGSILIGMQRGLARYQDGRVEKLGEFEQPITDLARDSEGRMWIATLGAGLWDYRGGRFTSHASDPAFNGIQTIFRLFSDSTGRLWVSLRNGGVVVQENGVFKAFDKIGKEAGEVSRMCEAPQGTLWFGTTRKLLRMRDGQVRSIGMKEGLENDNGDVTSFCTDGDGRLWIAARWLYRSVDAEADSFIQVPSPPDAICRIVIADREGSVWVGTSGSGLLQIRESAFRVMPLQPTGALVSGVRSVSQAPDGSIWAALAPIGVVRILPDGQMASISLGSGPEAEGWSILAASDGQVWIGTRGALFSWQGGKLERYPDYINVHILHQDRSGAIWLGMDNRGIYRRQNGKFESMAGVVGTATASATAFAEDAGGALYIGVDSGLVKFSDGKATRCDPGDSAPGLDVRSICLDGRNLWVGTKSRGLMLLREGRWYNPDSLIEPLGERVSAVVEDARENLWLGTAKGIVWAPKREFLAAALGQPSSGFHWANSGEGVRAGTVGYGSHPVSLVATDGRLFFASHVGLIQVNPKNISFNKTPPIVQIERVMVDGNEAKSSDEIILPPGTRSLAIDYAALSFVRPTSIAYRYRLEKHDDKWVDAGTRRTAYYTNLRPGNYRFRVLACNSDGVWNETGAVLGLIQKPWYYETWWFYTAAALGTVCLGLGIYRLRTRALRKENERLERGIAERTRELVQARKMEAIGQLAGGVAHDFNNILTAILMQLGLLLDEKDLNSSARDGLQDLEKQAKRAASLTRQLLAFSRRQVMQSRAFDLNAMLEELFKMLRRLLGENIDLEFKGGQPLWIDGDIAMIEQVVTNLCLNARDAMAPKGGRLVIETRLRNLNDAEAKASPEARAGAFVYLSVTDRGCGMDEKTLQHIFEPFFTTKEVSKGTGLGLATVYGIIKQHRGWLEVASKVGSGSTFSIYLPSRTAPATAGPGNAAERTPRGNETILIVEDENAVRTMASRSLQKCGYRVLEAIDGREAISAWDKHGPGIDLLFSDMVMPNGITGLELAERFRLTKPGLKVIVTSGYSVDLRKAGISGKSSFVYLAKPYETKDLGAAVRNCLDGANGN